MSGRLATSLMVSVYESFFLTESVIYVGMLHIVQYWYEKWSRLNDYESVGM